MIVQILVSSASPAQQADLRRRIVEQVQGMGLSVDASEFTPSAETLSEVASVPAGRASVRVYES